MSSGGSGGEMDEAERRKRQEGRKLKKIRFDRNEFELSARQKMKGLHFFFISIKF